MQLPSYDEMLEQAFKEVKPVEVGERFEVPKAKVYNEGIKTIIINFSQICSLLNRKPEHVAKFLMRELAVSATIDGQRLVLNRRVRVDKINEKIEAYVKKYVLCPECKKPDTKLIKQDRFTFIQCLACGAKHAVAE